MKCICMLRCPMWLPMSQAMSGVKYSANMLRLKTVKTKIGFVTILAAGECRPHTIHSRRPHRPVVEGFSARRARVRGPPRTKNIGASMDMVMCCTMCSPSETWA